MWQTEPVAHEASADLPARVVVDELASHLAESLGLNMDPEQLHEAAQRALGLREDESDALELVRLLCDELGLRAVQATSGASKLIEAVGPRHPVVVEDAQGRLVMLEDRKGKRVRKVVPGREPMRWVRTGS